MRRMGPRTRASTPSGGRSALLTVDGDLINRSEVFDEADLDAALARFDQLSRPAPRLENAASQVCERFLAHFAARDWDALREDTGRRHLRRRSPAGRERRDPTWSRCRDRKHAGGRRRRVHVHDVGRHRDPRGAPRPRASPRPRCSGPEAFHHRGAAASSKSTPTIGSRRSSCSTSTTSMPPSPSSMPGTSPAKRPPTRTRGRSSRVLTPRSTGANSRRRRRTG